MNHAVCNVESRPLNFWKSVSTVQRVELTAAGRQPEHGASTPEASSDTAGVGEQDGGVSERGVILIASY